MHLGIRKLFPSLFPPLSPEGYWKNRVRDHGPRSVINLAHQNIEEITAMQEREIFPYLSAHLDGTEKRLLDFGCGAGRFSVQLAKLIHGEVLGVDPMQELLDRAPKTKNVSYLRLPKKFIPASNHSFDVIWSCLVMGAVKDPKQTIEEMQRVLRPGGLMFLIENTAEKPSSPYWTFRSIEEYQTLFSFANLTHLHDYFDVGERISIFAGRVS